MDEQTRRTGLDIIGDVPWGTHFCHFYRTKHELIDVLVPYFKAGLESNESCMWVTSEPLVEQDARKAMSEAMPGFDRYLKTGQIEIMPHDRWYLQDGVFDSDRVLRGWVGKLDSALARGYSGLRAAGNTAWLEKKDWESFADYEAAVTSVTGKYKMVVLCSYWLEKCGAAEVIEAARNHAFAIVSHNGNPELVEGTLYRQTREALAQLRASEERNRLLVENATEGIVVIQDGEIVFANSQITEVIGHSEAGQPSRPITELIHPDDRQMVIELLLRTVRGEGVPGTHSFRIINKEGNIRWIEANMALFTWNGRPAVLGHATDITEHRMAEEELRASEERNRLLVENAAEGIAVLQDGKVVFSNPKYIEIVGFPEEELTSMPFSELVHPDDRQIVTERYLKRLKGEEIPPTYAVRAIDKAGNVKWVEATAVLFTWKGSPALLAMVADITERKKVELQVRERTKELQAFYSLAEITEREGITLDQLYQEFINILPKSWLYPEIACARIAIGASEFRTTNFMDSAWKQSAPVKVNGAVVGRVEVGYLEERPEEGEGPFLKEERLLIDAIAERLGRITEGKRAEEELQRQQKHFRALIENASDAITIAGADGTISYESPSCERMSGFKPEERIGANIIERIHPDDIKLLSDTFSQLIRHPGSTTGDEIRLRHKDGTWLTVEATVTNLLHDPAVNGIVVNLRAITERKQAEEALRQSEEKYRLLFENTNDAIYLHEVSPVGPRKIFAANEAACRMLGYTREELLRMTIADIDVPEHTKNIPAILDRLFSEGNAVFETEHLRKDGSRLQVLVSIRTFYLHGTMVMLSIVRDITESKGAEEALQESEQKFRAIFDNANDGFISADPESGRFFNPNRRMIEMLGYESEQETRNLTVSDIHPRKDLPHILREFEKHARREISRSEDLPVKRKDGSVFFASISSFLVTIANKPYLSCIFRDVTERKQAEEMRRTFYNRLVEVQEKERQTLARELHDGFGQPLIIVKLYLDKERLKAPGDIDPELEQAREVLQELIHLVRNTSVNLRPTMLDDLGLLPTLLWHFERYTRQTKISVNFRHTGLKRPLPPESCQHRLSPCAGSTDQCLSPCPSG